MTTDDRPPTTDHEELPAAGPSGVRGELPTTVGRGRWSVVGGRSSVVGPPLLILLLALVPRLIGLGWALPDASRYYSYHPDEPVLVNAVLQIRFGDLQLSPRFYNYGSLFLYQCRAAIDLAAAAGWVDPRRPNLLLEPHGMARWVGDFARLHWIGRLVAALMGALTALVVYGLGRRLYGERAARLAGVFMALAPLHLVHSHFMAVDVPATFWVAAALWGAAWAREKPIRPRWFLAGVLAGFAAGTKYNCGLVALAALVALAQTVRQAPREGRRDAALDGGVYLILGVGLGFLFATPGPLIDSARFFHDLAYERRHMAQGHDLVFIGTAPGWIHHVTDSLGGGLGWPATLLCLAGLTWAVWRRHPTDLVLLAYLVPYYLLIGAFQVKFARYMIPLLPVLALWLGRLLVEAPSSLRTRLGNRVAAAFSLLAGAVLLWTALYATALEALLVTPDSRTRAADWVKRQVAGQTPPRADHQLSVALLRPPWYYTPPLSPGIGCFKAMLAFCLPEFPTELRLVAPPEDQAYLAPQRLREELPDFVIANEFEYADPLRLAHQTGVSNEMTELWRQLHQNHEEAAVFTHRPRLGPLSWFSRRTPPHDLLYIMPTTRIFARRGGY